MPAPTKPSVSIIGTGRLGSALALALRRSGYPIVGLVARHARKSEAAARLLRLDKPESVGKYRTGSDGDRVFTKAGVRRSKTGSHQSPLALATKDLKRLLRSDLILICTPDDEIEKLAGRLARYTETRTILHTSGALSSEVLAPLARIGLHTGSLHPLISVSEPKAGADSFAGAFFCVEGDSQAMRVARRIVADLEGSAFSISSENKALYHAAAVMASPHTTALFDIAVTTLVAAGPERKIARRVLIPLLESTVQNLKTLDPADALTGTFARGDIATVKRHLKALSGKEHGEILKIYKLLGQHSLSLAAKQGLDQKLINSMKRLLK